MNLIIVSGLSGSGKTVALQALEDIGYYCIDNLPANLLPHFARNLMDDPQNLAAVSIDVRNRQYLSTLSDSLQELSDLGIDYRILYLSADQETLLRRFNETRRRHPLTDRSTSLVEGIDLEHRLLEDLSRRASMKIDSSNITPHELRSQVRNLVGARDGSGMMLQIVSFGHKHGHPGDADFVFDVRCLPNPYWHEDLRGLTGLDPEVAEFLEAQPQTTVMTDQIAGFLQQWLPAFENENRSYITIAIGCTGGRHRSVYIAEQLAVRFEDQSPVVQVRHRDLL